MARPPLGENFEAAIRESMRRTERTGQRYHARRVGGGPWAVVRSGQRAPARPMTGGVTVLEARLARVEARLAWIEVALELDEAWDRAAG